MSSTLSASSLSPTNHVLKTLVKQTKGSKDIPNGGTKNKDGIEINTRKGTVKISLSEAVVLTIVAVVVVALIFTIPGALNNAVTALIDRYYPESYVLGRFVYLIILIAITIPIVYIVFYFSVVDVKQLSV